jgi:transcriptional regulator with XRE-family HTH domain
MPKTPAALEAIPPAATQALHALGENLAIARGRRRESQRTWAKRLGISVPTLIRMERGDPGVGAGIYATALWLMGTVSGLAELASPAADRGALESEVRSVVRRRAVRSAASVEARLGRKNMGRKNMRRDDPGPPNPALKSVARKKQRVAS